MRTDLRTDIILAPLAVSLGYVIGFRCSSGPFGKDTTDLGEIRKQQSRGASVDFKGKHCHIWGVRAEDEHYFHRMKDGVFTSSKVKGVGKKYNLSCWRLMWTDEKNFPDATNVQHFTDNKLEEALRLGANPRPQPKETV